MTGGDGNDRFWGEVNFALTGVSGGNDTFARGQRR